MFGPSGPSSGSLRWSLLKLHFCRIISKIRLYKFCSVVVTCVYRVPCRVALCTAPEIHTLQPETHVATTLQNL
jgi:hypothetical protein